MDHVSKLDHNLELKLSRASQANHLRDTVPAQESAASCGLARGDAYLPAPLVYKCIKPIFSFDFCLSPFLIN